MLGAQGSVQSSVWLEPQHTLCSFGTRLLIWYSEALKVVRRALTKGDAPGLRVRHEWLFMENRMETKEVIVDPFVSWGKRKNDQPCQSKCFKKGIGRKGRAE